MKAPPDPIHLISLGAGVQSSTMALMAARGEISPKPHAAIFADTQAEPQIVYRWLDWLEKPLPFPVYRVTQGSLEEDTLRVRTRKDGKGTWVPSGIPAYTTNAGGSKGQMPRQCTHDFKLSPFRREVRRLMKEVGVKSAVSWIGISLDEVDRMRPSGVRYLTNRWPLVDLRMTRNDCLRWMARHGYPKPPRSACVFCPYRNDAEWRYLRDQEPQEFQRAVDFEGKWRAAKQQTLAPTVYNLFLHASRVPLPEVDFSDGEQLNLFRNECEGMCGV
jgi:hypothetical protein